MLTDEIRCVKQATSKGRACERKIQSELNFNALANAMNKEQIKELEDVHWFDQLISIKISADLFEKLGLRLTNKKQKSAASCLLANCYLLSRHPTHKYLAISRRPEAYTNSRYVGEAVGYRSLVDRVLPEFKRLDLIKLIKIGFVEREVEFGAGHGRRSRYQPTEKLLSFLTTQEIALDDVDKGNPELIRLRSEKAKKNYRRKQEKKPTGTLINYTDTNKTHELRSWLMEYNTFVQSFTTELPPQLEPLSREATRFYRVFNVDFEHGGRLVGHWIFDIKRDNRHLLKLNGEEVTELDYKSMYPHLLYSSADLNYHQFHDDNDPYQLAGFDRELVKIGFLVAMNNNTKKGFGRALKHRLREEGWPEEKLNFNSTPLLNAILQKHEPVEHLLFDKDKSNYCTYLEAMLIQTVLNHYLDWKVPVLPMHDGVITVVRERNRLKNAMTFEAELMLTSAPSVVVEY